MPVFSRQSLLISHSNVEQVVFIRRASVEQTVLISHTIVEQAMFIRHTSVEQTFSVDQACQFSTDSQC